MSRRNFILGYFINNGEKNKLLKFLDEKNYILESSKKARGVIKNNDNFIYSPQKLYYQGYDGFLSYFRGSIKSIDEKKLLRKLYKKDLKEFISRKVTLEKILNNKWYFLLLTFFQIFIQRNSYGFSIRDYLSCYRLYKMDINPEYFFLGSKNKAFKQFIKIRSSFNIFLFRFAFLNGFKNIKSNINKLNFTKEDYFFSWGREDSTSLLFRYFFKQKSTNFYVIEWGELPGTFQINKHGIFGDSDMHHNFDLDKFRSIDIDNKTKIQFDKLFLNKPLFSFNSLAFNAFRKKSIEKKIIYVNGVELFASGHINRKDHEIDSFDKKINNPNEYLLAYVCKFFDLSKYTIIYKEHPLMTQNGDCLINKKDYGSVSFIDCDLTEIINYIDGVISLPSKVVTFASLHQKPVHVWGQFTIPVDVAMLGYFLGYDLSKFDQFILSGANVSREDSIRLFKYYRSNLIAYDYGLYSSSFFDEKTKLKSLTESR